MQFIKPDINVDFIGKRKIAYTVSAAMILISIASLIVHGGPRFGIDFSGGTLIQIQFEKAADIPKIKDGMSMVGLESYAVQSFGEENAHEYLIRTDMSGITETGFADRLKKAMEDTLGQAPEIRRIEMVGPQVGKDLREKALFAMFYALLFITIYISGRFELKWLLSGVVAVALIAAIYFFRLFDVSIPFLIGTALLVSLALFWFLELKYAMGAIVALIHDVTITVGI
ncbi:MAG: protein translocase subunit SecF, partial [Desulfobacterales bacterium]